MHKDRTDYEVGYGKPPAETRFEKGKLGNPKGRPKGSRSFASTFHGVTQELIHVRENGQSRTITKLEAIMRQLTAKAMSGDIKAAKEILQWNRVFEDAAQQETIDTPDMEKDAAVLRAFLKRAAAMRTVSASTPSPTDEGVPHDGVE